MPDANGNLVQGDPGFVPGMINAPKPVTTFTPKEAGATGYTPDPFAVKPEYTVANQVDRLTSSDSPLLQRAEARAREKMNEKGLLHSSLAIGEERKAVYDTALPIAMADAQVYERGGTNTVNAENVAKQFGATSENAASLFNAGEANKQMFQAADSVLRTQLAQIQADTTLTATDKQTQSAQLIAQRDNETKQLLALIQADTTLTVTDKQTQSAQLISRGDNDTKRLLMTMQNWAELTKAELAADTQLAIAKIDRATKQELAQLDANNRQLLQANAGLANMFQETVKNIAAIATSDTMSSLAKQDATESQLRLLNEAMQALGSVASTHQFDIASLKLGDYFFDKNEATTEQDTVRQKMSAIKPEDIAPGNPAVMIAINALGRDRWDGLVNVFERGAPYSSGTHVMLGLLREEVERVLGLR